MKTDARETRGGSHVVSTKSDLERAFEYYEQLDRMRKFVLSRLDEGVSSTEAAEVAGLSAKYFSAFFRQHTGMCFRDWLALVRIERAQELLAQNNHSITRVAFSVGFKDIRTFQRAFKKISGVTPRAYKRAVAP